MFNIGAGEMTLIAVVALLLLGPKRLPELARGIGKFLREFRRQADDVRGVVEREFYRMDDEVSIKEPPLTLTQPEGAVTHDNSLPAITLPPIVDDLRSQALMPASPSEPVEPAASTSTTTEASAPATEATAPSAPTEADKPAT